MGGKLWHGVLPASTLFLPKILLTGVRGTGCSSPVFSRQARSRGASGAALTRTLKSE